MFFRLLTEGRCGGDRRWRFVETCGRKRRQVNAKRAEKGKDWFLIEKSIMMITTMMSRFIFTFVLCPILCSGRRNGKTYVPREVACFMTTGCTERISDDVFMNGHHLTHCGKRERVLDVEWYLFMLTCKNGKTKIWWETREEWLRFSCFYSFVRCKEYA